MEKKRILFICLIIFIITFCYDYFISYLNLDEIWNYGFSYNISCGLVPYRDFNMLQMPLFFFIGSMFIKVFGNHLWSVHIFNSILIASMMLIIIKKIGIKGLILYPVILIYAFYSYNTFCLLLGLLMLGSLDKDSKYSDYFIAFIISLIFLSKQNIGICLFVPMIYYSKNKIKSFIVFLIPNLVLLIYLIINNCLYDFINYTFLGMFDFGKSNGIYHFVLFYVMLVFYLVYKLIKSKFKDKYIFYILAFQVVGFPIIDDYHFMVGFILFLYYILLVKDISKRYYKYIFIVSISFFFIYLVDTDIKMLDYDLFHIRLYSNKDSFLYGRNFSMKSQKLLNDLSNYVYNSRDVYGDNVYVFSNWAYLIKLNMGENPGIYDFILDGNMGYKGEEKIISSISDTCSDNKCLFVVQCGGNQLSFNIVKYVVTNYKKIGVIEDIDHYTYIKKKANYLIYTND